MVTRAAQVMLMSLLLAGLMITGCAKRPATTAATAAAPAPAPAERRDSSTDPERAVVRPDRRSARRGRAAAPAPRPEPKEFMAVAALQRSLFRFRQVRDPPRAARRPSTPTRPG